MLTKNCRLGELIDNPIGRDLLGRLVQYAGVSPKLLTNPLVRLLPLSMLQKISGGMVDDTLVESLLELCNDCADEAAPIGSSDAAWWKEAVVYQIYPRSFADSNGDGIGDLRGILEKLPYLERLGINAIWLSPVFDSPNDDNGYDVRDYRKIMAEFGSMEEMDALIAAAHARGIRIILDMVLNHTSDEHEWYQKALAGDPVYAQYYIFRDGTPDAPPNNWRSNFSGSAWKYEEKKQAWALHLFSKKQMDLNWENPRVREEVSDIVRFWRERGVDGFRFDVINLISKTSLDDGNETIGSLLGLTGIEHYFYGKHLHEYLRELRQKGLVDAFAVGETPGTGPEMNKLLTAASRKELDVVFCFDHLEMVGKMRFDSYVYDLNHLKDCFTTYQGAYADTAWPTIFLENHDNPRMVSKVEPSLAHREELAKLLAMLQLTARGTVFLYQGQELGAANVTFKDITELRDVESLNRYRELVDGGMSEADAFSNILGGTRDHARVPMMWDGSEKSGFTTGTPWIRTSDDAVTCNVAAQQDDPNSVLSFYRMLIGLRRAIPALVYGTFEPVAKKRRNVFCYYRTIGETRYYVETNLTDKPQRRAIAIGSMELLVSNYAERAQMLRPYEASLYRV